MIGYFRITCKIVLASLVPCICASVASGQTDDLLSIRVDSNVVLVSAEVLHKDKTPRMRSIHNGCVANNVTAFANLPFSEPIMPADCEKILAFYDLGLKDFHVFEDGTEQKVDNVIREPWPWILERDMRNGSVTYHQAWSYTPRGIWRGSDTPSSPNARHYYRISYVPPKLESGKCHRVKVTVDRPDTAVFYTDQYCYIKHPATDPLMGTEFEKRMEAELSADAQPKIPLLAQAGFFYTDAHLAKLDLVLSFPFKKLASSWSFWGDLHTSIGIVGTLSTRNGSVVARFSDSAVLPWTWLHDDAASDAWLAAFMPNSYQTQLDVPPGDYVLRVVLDDSEKFGRVSFPIHVAPYEGTQLTLSSLFLFQRYRLAAVADQEAAAVNLAPDYVRLASQDIHVTPTADSTFERKQLLAVYFQAYEPLLGQQPGISVQARLRIVDEASGKVQEDLPWFDAASYRRTGGNTFAITKTIHLNQLKKGAYRVEAQVKDSAGHTTPWSSAAFSVKAWF